MAPARARAPANRRNQRTPPLIERCRAAPGVGRSDAGRRAAGRLQYCGRLDGGGGVRGGSRTARAGPFTGLVVGTIRWRSGRCGRCASAACGCRRMCRSSSLKTFPRPLFLDPPDDRAAGLRGARAADGRLPAHLGAAPGDAAPPKDALPAVCGALEHGASPQLGTRNTAWTDG